MFFADDIRVAVMTAAQEVCARRGDSRIGTDHLLVGVVAAGNRVAAGAGLTVDGLYDALDRLDERALGAIGIEAASFTVFPPWSFRRRGHLPFSRGARKSLERSLRIALDLGHRRITTDHLLAGLAGGGPNDPAMRLLRACWVEASDLEAAVRQAMRPQAS
ncbi:MAG: Clp protease N-terminal domain-containing protein [Acidimicrobiia bacterium]